MVHQLSTAHPVRTAEERIHILVLMQHYVIQDSLFCRVIHTTSVHSVCFLVSCNSPNLHRTVLQNQNVSHVWYTICNYSCGLHLAITLLRSLMTNGVWKTCVNQVLTSSVVTDHIQTRLNQNKLHSVLFLFTHFLLHFSSCPLLSPHWLWLWLNWLTRSLYKKIDVRNIRMQNISERLTVCLKSKGSDTTPAPVNISLTKGNAK